MRVHTSDERTAAEFRRVTVVGGGPAGTAAASAAASQGIAVRLIDAAPRLGGFPRHSPSLPANVEHLPGTTVHDLEATERGHLLRLRSGPGDLPGRAVETAALVLATGAHDRALPFPGSDLPGVHTAGAALTMLTRHDTAIGSRVIVAGTGPFLLAVAAELADAGVEVVAVLEAGEPVSRWIANAPRAITGWRRAGRFAGHARTLAAHGVPLCRRSAVVAAYGTERLDAVMAARLDDDWRPIASSKRRFEVDAIAVGFGFEPDLALPTAARCAIHNGFVEVDAVQATSVPGVYAAGEITGIGGADLARDEGVVAGHAAAKFVGAQVSAPVLAMARARSGRRFAAALAAAYPIGPGWRRWQEDAGAHRGR